MNQYPAATARRTVPADSIVTSKIGGIQDFFGHISDRIVGTV
jgi:hypothetical protein